MKTLNQRKKEFGTAYNNLCSCYGNIIKKREKAISDCKILAQKLLQAKPELREWLELNYKEYL